MRYPVAPAQHSGARTRTLEERNPTMYESDAGSPRAEERGRLAEGESARGDVRGAPTRPAPPAVLHGEPEAPPVGLNWATVGHRLGIDVHRLEHDGQIILIGEYFPESGFALDTGTLAARPVDVGQIALQRAYFLGSLPFREMHATLPVDHDPSTVQHPIVHADRGPIIGLFTERASAERARHLILRGSLGSQLRIEAGPLGTELHVRETEQPGRVATVVAAEHGAVIAVSGAPIVGVSTRPLASGGAVGHGDALRGGIGVTSDTIAPNPPPDQSGLPA